MLNKANSTILQIGSLSFLKSYCFQLRMHDFWGVHALTTLLHQNAFPLRFRSCFGRERQNRQTWICALVWLCACEISAATFSKKQFTPPDSWQYYHAITLQNTQKKICLKPATMEHMLGNHTRVEVTNIIFVLKAWRYCMNYV